MKTIAFALVLCTWLVCCEWTYARGELKTGTSDSRTCAAFTFFLFCLFLSVAMIER